MLLIRFNCAKLSINIHLSKNLLVFMTCWCACMHNYAKMYTNNFKLADKVFPYIL